MFEEPAEEARHARLQRRGLVVDPAAAVKHDDARERGGSLRSRRVGVHDVETLHGVAGRTECCLRRGTRSRAPRFPAWRSESDMGGVTAPPPSVDDPALPPAPAVPAGRPRSRCRRRAARARSALGPGLAARAPPSDASRAVPAGARPGLPASTRGAVPAGSRCGLSASAPAPLAAAGAHRRPRRRSRRCPTRSARRFPRRPRRRFRRCPTSGLHLPSWSSRRPASTTPATPATADVSSRFST